MSAVSKRHILAQAPVVASLVRTASSAMRNRPSGVPETPGPVLTATVGARSDRLVNDYIRHVGGNPSWYRGQLPPHLFPQWGFPLLAKCLDSIPYDIRKVLNGGCRIEVHQPLPAGEKLHLRASLEEIDDNGRRAVLKTRLVTGTDSAPDALVAWMYAIVPLKRDKSAPKKPKPRVPLGDREIDQWRLGPKAGWEFAVLTGDFNPVHWVPPYARAAGFRNCILHGFSTLARAIESVNRNVMSGDAGWLRTIDVRFVRPLTLPARPRVFHGPGRVAVGDAPGGPAYLIGDLLELPDA